MPLETDQNPAPGASGAAPSPAPAAPAGRPAPALLAHPRAPIAIVAGLYMLALVVYGLIAKSHSIPSLFPDEMIYGNVAQSIARGDGANWRGSGQGVPLLYPLLISPGFTAGSAVDGYLIAKLIGVAVVSLTVVPVFLLARELIGPRLALVPAALSVAGTWMLYSQELVSENLALPLGAASLCATVMALRRPGSRWIWIAFLFAAAGIGTRVMLLALPPIIAAALALDIVRQPAGQRAARAHLHRAALAVIAAAIAAGGLYLLVKGDTTVGRYAIFPSGISVSHALKGAVNQGLLAVVMVGVIPFAGALALAVRGASWRDEATGPLLAVLVPAMLGISLLAGWFIEGNGYPFPVQRYVVYLAPLLLIAMMLVPGRVPLWLALGAGLASALLLLALPAVTQVLEQSALYGSTQRLGQLISSFEAENHPSLGLFLVALPIACGGMWLLATRGTLAAATVVFAVLVVQVQAVTHSHLSFIHEARAQFPEHLDWVDRASSGPAAIVNQGQFVGYDRLEGRKIVRPNYWTEFFNPDIDTMYVVGDVAREQAGPTCPWAFQQDGTISPLTTKCHALPRLVVFGTAPYVTRFRGERALAQNSTARLVDTGPARPVKAFSFVRVPCIATACADSIAASFFLRQEGELLARFRGQGGEHRVDIEGETATVGPADTKTLRVSVPARPRGFDIGIRGSGTFPAVTLRVREGAKVTQVYP